MMATGERHRNGLKTALQKPENSIAHTAKVYKKSELPLCNSVSLIFFAQKRMQKTSEVCIEKCRILH